MGKPILMKGNEALAEAALIAGCRHYFAYPITPQNEVSAYLALRLPEVEDAVSLVSRISGVRDALVRRIRDHHRGDLDPLIDALQLAHEAEQLGSDNS